MPRQLRAPEEPTLARAKKDNLPCQQYPIVTGHWPRHLQVMVSPVNLKISKTLNKPSWEIFLDSLLPLCTSDRHSRVVVLGRPAKRLSLEQD